jgi:hypothetical protein
LLQQEYFDETQVLIADGAAMFYDNLDATKLFSHHPQMPQLFSRSTDDRWLSVNTLPEITQKTTVPLSYSAATQGPATLTIHEITGQLAKVQVYLHDQLLDTIVNLSQTLHYPFNASSGVHHDRFLLSFASSDTLLNSTLHAYAHKNILVVHSLLPKATLMVYTPEGKQVLNLTLGPGTHQIPTSLAQGVYLVKLFGTDTALTKKLFLARE